MLRVLSGLAVVEAGGIDPVGHMVHLVPPYLVHRTACGNVIDHMPVGTGNDGGIVGALGPALDLDAVNTGIHEIGKVVDHAHIPGIEDVSTLFVLVNGEVLPGPFFLHQGILVAAGLGTGTPVGVTAGHVVAEQTTAGVADAHGAVAEGLNLQLWVNLFADLGHFLQAAFSCQHHPLGTQVEPGLGAFVVGDGLLGGDVALAMGGILSRQGEGTQVGNDQGIHPRIVQPLQVSGQLGDFLVAGHNVHGYMGLDTMVVGEFHRLRKLLRGEVTGEGTHTEVSSCQIHRIRTVENGHFQPLHISGGGEKFQFFHA